MTKKIEDLEAALDLRAFMDRVEKIGELKVIRGAHWKLEIGALSEILADSHGMPAILFDDIVGYPKGFRLLSNVLQSPQREALILGLPPETKGLQLLETVKERLSNMTPIPPSDVGEGPILENIISEEKVNIFNFPVPLWHEQDGGRFIGTFDAVITRDPDTGYVNIGTYRIQVHDEKTVGLFMIPGKHGDLIAQKYWAKGESCPFIIACGIPASMMIASSVGIPWGMSEYDFLGGLLGAPIPVLKGNITGLPMPAFAEIVLEGYSPPPDGNSVPEGPFGEWPGYYATGLRDAPIVKVKTVYHRNNPIITGAPPLKTYLNHEAHKHIRAANIWSAMERAGIPGVRGVWFPQQGRFLVAVSIQQKYPGHARQAGYGVLATRDGGRDVRIVVVVDDDIDITNINELMWAICTRWDPKTASEIVNVPASTLNPRLTPQQKETSDWVSSCIVIDACRPYSWINEFPAVSAFTPQYKEEIMRKWGLT
jgi:UbiD family decarboxylase